MGDGENVGVALGVKAVGVGVNVRVAVGVNAVGKGVFVRVGVGVKTGVDLEGAVEVAV